MVNRKLIRPSLTDLREQEQAKYSRNQKKRIPPEQTSAEEYYYLKQMANKTPMVVHLVDGEVLHGIIEWYDKNCIKVNRATEPNLLLPKRSIKYLFKENEAEDSDQQQIEYYPTNGDK